MAAGVTDHVWTLTAIAGLLALARGKQFPQAQRCAAKRPGVLLAIERLLARTSASVA
jgi:hypothetical protein